MAKSERAAADAAAVAHGGGDGLATAAEADDDGDADADASNATAPSRAAPTGHRFQLLRDNSSTLQLLHKPPSVAGRVENWVLALPPWIGPLVMSLVAHTIFGAYPVIARYLVTPPISLPPMEVLWIGSGINCLFVVPVALYQRGWKVFKYVSLWSFSVVTALRALTNILASKYTLAMFVQLFALTTPFFVAIMQRIFLKEPLPKRFLSSVILSTVGSLFVLSDQLFAIDLSDVATGEQLLGMLFALISAFCLALYMVLMRIASKEHQPISVTLSAQMAAMTIVPFFVAFGLEAPIAERWGPWAAMDASGWIAFFFVVFLVFFSGNVLNYLTTTLGGAAFTVSFMGFRLAVAVLLGWMLLDEPLTSVYQGIGVAIVMASLAYFSFGNMKKPPAAPVAAPPAQPVPPELSPPSSDHLEMQVIDVDETDSANLISKA